MHYSPTLSIATGALELGAMFWILRGRNEATIRRFLALLLGLLAGYQFLEALICGAHGPMWLSRFAFADIAWLPPVGIALIVTLAKPRSRWPRVGANAFLGLAAAWSAVVLLVPDFISMTVCEAVYAKYRTAQPLLYNLYGVYYDLGLLTLLFGGTWAAAHCTNPLRRALIADFVAGNLAFVLLAMMTMLVLANTRGASPSILCHYAILLAVAIAHMGLRLNRSVDGYEESPDVLETSVR